MHFLRSIKVEGLFGLYDHAIELRSDSPVTLVAGPNGVGKTTLLSLTRALLQGNYREVVRVSFDSLRIDRDDGQSIFAQRIGPNLDAEGSADLPNLRLVLTGRGGKSLGDVTFPVPAHPAGLSLPSYVEPLSGDSYFDSRLQDVITVEEAVARYGRSGVRASEQAKLNPDPPSWFTSEDWRVDFIETKRLDTLISRARPVRRRESPPAPIDVYLTNVTRTIDSARRESTIIRQRLDRTYVRRLLNRSKANVNETQLRSRHSRIETLAEELRANGLLAESLEVLPSGKITPTDKRIISLFLDDFEKKLAPLIPVSQKLEQLRAVIGNKFLNKTMTVDANGGVLFSAEPYGEAISADALSSGEQHALALMTRLLFSEAPGTTVLVDEPELSLHVSWQHAMVDDLQQIGLAADLRFVLATHSTAIINNRWELVEDLGDLGEE